MRCERRLGLNYRKSLARLFQLTNADTRCRLVLMNMTNQPGGGTQILFNPFETALLLPPRHPRTHNKPPPVTRNGPSARHSSTAAAGRELDCRAAPTRRGFQADNLSGMLVWFRSSYTGLRALRIISNLWSNFCLFQPKSLVFLQEVREICSNIQVGSITFKIWSNYEVLFCFVDTLSDKTSA